MAEALQGIGNLWDNLTELHHKDPKKYQQIIEESAKEYAKLKLPPVPHTCVLARDKDKISYFINILAWERIPNDKNGALPMAGGYLTRKFEKMVYSLAVNSNVLQDIMVKGNKNEKSDLIRLAMQFVEARNPGLCFDPESWNFIRGKEFEGNLNEIQELFLNPTKAANHNSPSLLSQLGHIATHTDNEENEPKIKTLRTENTPQKKMVQEMKSGRKSPQSEFAKNLKNNYLKSNDSETSGKNNENIQEVKIYENLAAQMEPVSTKQFTPKTPLFGRAYSTEKNEVRLKFLLNGVDEMKSIFFYFPEMGKFGLQTTNGYSIRDYVLSDGSKNKSWKIHHQDLDLTSNHPVFSVHLINQ